MIIKCKYFKCADRENCSEKGCSGCGGEGYQNCGCDVCLNHSYEGDAEICEVALVLLEKEMEE